jgi:protein TonB
LKHAAVLDATMPSFRRPDPLARRAADAMPDAAPAVADWQPCGYRASRRALAPAGVAALIVGGGLIAALAGLGVDMPPAHAPYDLVVLSVSLTPPPPPPPARPQTKPVLEASAPERIAAPVPIVEPPRPAAPAATIAAPVPVAVPAPVAAASPGPPAPPSPPATTEAGDLSSRMIEAKPPPYPVESRRRHEEGVVVLDVLVSLEGLVSDISVARSSGFGLLDHAALAAVRRWRWAPLLRDDRPVMVRGQVRMPFVLRR